MASLYRKKNSPFWFIQFIDADGTRRNRSTGFHADNPAETIRARTLRAQTEAKELNRNAGEINGGSWDTWVTQYLERHCESPRTLQRYTGNWQWLAFWLQERHLHSPRAITYRNALEYIDWRTTYKKRTGKTVGRNTAIMELKLLAMIMGGGCSEKAPFGTGVECQRICGARWHLLLHVPHMVSCARLSGVLWCRVLAGFRAMAHDAKRFTNHQNGASRQAGHRYQPATESSKNSFGGIKYFSWKANFNRIPDQKSLEMESFCKTVNLLHFYCTSS